MSRYKGSVLSIAGSDPSGGAGIQADIKTITMLGCYASCCITSITAQNTLEVYGTWDLTREIVQKQITAVLSDIEVDSIKIGMLPVPLIECVARIIPDTMPVVLDPVLLSSSGFTLVESEFADHIGTLLEKTTLVTPNLPEAEVLSRMKILTRQDMLKAGEIIRSMGTSVLLKGGHLEEEQIEDILFVEDSEVLSFKSTRVPEVLHGTGCTLSSAIASFLAQGIPLEKSVELAIGYLRKTLQDIPKIGKGCSPVFHNYSLESSTK